MDYKDKYNMYKYKFFNLRRQFDKFNEEQKYKCRSDKYKNLVIIIYIRLKYIIEMIFCNIFIMN